MSGYTDPPAQSTSTPTTTKAKYLNKDTEEEETGSTTAIPQGSPIPPATEKPAVPPSAIDPPKSLPDLYPADKGDKVKQSEARERRK